MSLCYSLFLLFLVFTHAQELCTKEVYSQYLSSYPIKCEGDCTEYTEWVIARDLRI